MRVGLSILLFAAGVVLRFGVEPSVSGTDLGVIAVLLMVVGALGALLSLAYWNRLGPSRRHAAMSRSWSERAATTADRRRHRRRADR